MSYAEIVDALKKETYRLDQIGKSIRLPIGQPRRFVSEAKNREIETAITSAETEMVSILDRIRELRTQLQNFVPPQPIRQQLGRRRNAPIPIEQLQQDIDDEVQIIQVVQPAPIFRPRQQIVDESLSSISSQDDFDHQSIGYQSPPYIQQEEEDNQEPPKLTRLYLIEPPQQQQEEEKEQISPPTRMDRLQDYPKIETILQKLKNFNNIKQALDSIYNIEGGIPSDKILVFNIEELQGYFQAYDKTELSIYRPPTCGSRAAFIDTVLKETQFDPDIPDTLYKLLRNTQTLMDILQFWTYKNNDSILTLPDYILHLLCVKGHLIRQVSQVANLEDKVSFVWVQIIQAIIQSFTEKIIDYYPVITMDPVSPDTIRQELAKYQQPVNTTFQYDLTAFELVPYSVTYTEQLQKLAFDQDCIICMDKIDLGQSVNESNCGHYFHYDCIYPHYATPNRNLDLMTANFLKGNQKCPCCNYPVYGPIKKHRN